MSSCTVELVPGGPAILQAQLQPRPSLFVVRGKNATQNKTSSDDHAQPQQQQMCSETLIFSRDDCLEHRRVPAKLYTLCVNSMLAAQKQGQQV